MSVPFRRYDFFSLCFTPFYVVHRYAHGDISSLGLVLEEMVVMHSENVHSNIIFGMFPFSLLAFPSLTYFLSAHFLFELSYLSLAFINVL